MTTTTCIVLAGGLGTRLRSTLPDLPKCLAPVGDRSFLEIQLELLTAQGVTDFVLSLGYLSELVEAEAARLRPRFSIRTVVESNPLGTGGAAALAMRTFGLSEAWLTNGDTFLGGSLAAMLAPLALAEGERARMAVLHVPDRSRFGGVSLFQDRVAGFVEKGLQGDGYINAGLYRLHASIFDRHAETAQFSLETAILPGLAIDGQLGAARIEGEFTDIGVPEDYFRFRDSLSHREGGR
jgi:D-glycero-alpha-D-manno-heptose 1-phosphate guanylyltransferase